jgi:hypothetical protein
MQPMVEMFRDTLDATTDSLVTAIDPTVIHRLQGRAQTLKDFLTLVDSGEQILERLSGRSL